MDRGLVKKFLIKLTYDCNNKCVFCHCDDKRGARKSLEFGEAVQKMAAAKGRGAEMIVLTGGEASVHPDFMRLCETVRKMGMSLGLVTNGRLLSYPEVAEQLLGLGLRYVHTSLHGATADSHNRQVRAEAFDEVISGIRNVAGRVPTLTVNCVVTKYNLDELSELIPLLGPFAPLELKYSLVFAMGAARQAFKALVPDPIAAAQAVWDAFQYARSHASESIEVTCDGFAPCLVPNEPDFRSDLMTHGYVSMTETFEDDFYPVDEGSRRFAPQCADCRARSRCLGIYSEYLDHFGDELLRPDRVTVPSSVRFLKQGRARPRRTADCALGVGPVTADTGRGLFLKENGHLDWYLSDSSDHSELQLWSVKTKLGQLYVQNGNRETGIQPGRDLKKLVPARACVECSHGGECVGAFETSADDVFHAFADGLEERLLQSRGRILEIGCGEEAVGRKVGEKLVEEGHGTYLGVDPSATVREGAGYQVRSIALEDFAWEGEPFDHLWMLNAYNHLREPERELSRVLGYLRAGGEVVWTDTTLCILLRGGVDEGGPRGLWEHYRNATSDDLLPLLTRWGLKLIEHRPVDPSTSNRWLIRARRVST